MGRIEEIAKARAFDLERKARLQRLNRTDGFGRLVVLDESLSDTEIAMQRKRAAMAMRMQEREAV